MRLAAVIVQLFNFLGLDCVEVAKIGLLLIKGPAKFH